MKHISCLRTRSDQQIESQHGIGMIDVVTTFQSCLSVIVLQYAAMLCLLHLVLLISAYMPFCAVQEQEKDSLRHDRLIGLQMQYK